MKHLARIVALLVVTLLVARPVLAAYACGGPCEMPACGHWCCMQPGQAMEQVPLMVGCSMHSGPVIAQACCDPETASALLDPAKAQVLIAGESKKLHAAVAGTNASAIPQAAARWAGVASVPSTTSKRSVLFQVFRI